MRDTLYAILNNSENSTLQYFIFCKKALDEQYLLKLIMFSRNQQAIRRSSTILFRLMFELFPFLCLKLYSLNFAIAYTQWLLGLSEFFILVLHLYA